MCFNYDFKIYFKNISYTTSGLTRRKGSEISLQEFEDLWSCCGGGAYSISNAKK